jgi:hypothetical protein
MLLEIDNKGAKDLIDNWSVGGRLHHVEVKQFFLRELKEQGLLKVKWLNSENNMSDIFTEESGRTAVQSACLSDLWTHDYCAWH